MNTLFFIGLLIPWGSGAATACNKNDHKIFRTQGTTFEARFRSFGGLWTGRDGFIEKVTEATGLSQSCAACYGDSYICGKSECWGSCAIGGERCTRCLHKNKCIQNCDACTGFKK